LVNKLICNKGEIQMKTYSIHFLLISLLLLSGCAQTTTKPYVSPTGNGVVPLEQQPEVRQPDRPVSRAEITRLLHATLFSPEKHDADGKEGKTGFVTPDDFQKETTPIMPNDIINHPLFLDITKILPYTFRGLAIDKDNLFHPDDTLSRAGFAMLAEDILARATKDDSLSTRYVGNISPFVDVGDDYFGLNAIFTVTARKILLPGVDGRFRPEEPITRNEAMDAVSNLQKAIK
jgi:hypothetical protein